GFFGPGADVRLRVELNMAEGFFDAADRPVRLEPEHFPARLVGPEPAMRQIHRPGAETRPVQGELRSPRDAAQFGRAIGDAALKPNIGSPQGVLGGFPS